MKHRLSTIIVVLMCFTTLRLSAQSKGPGTQYYTFQKSFAPYIVLDTTKMHCANCGAVWVEDDIDSIPIGFQFRFLDHYITSLYSNQINLFLPHRDYYFTPF